MKAVAYTRVSTSDQSTKRQVNDLKQVEGFQIQKVFSENVSGFSKGMEERKELQDMLKYVKKEGIECIMVSEISRLGRNTRETLRSEEHTSELQSRENLVCRLLLEKERR